LSEKIKEREGNYIFTYLVKVKGRPLSEFRKVWDVQKENLEVQEEAPLYLSFKTHDDVIWFWDTNGRRRIALMFQMIFNLF